MGAKGLGRGQRLWRGGRRYDILRVEGLRGPFNFDGKSVASNLQLVLKSMQSNDIF